MSPPSRSRSPVRSLFLGAPIFGAAVLGLLGCNPTSPPASETIVGPDTQLVRLTEVETGDGSEKHGVELSDVYRRVIRGAASSEIPLPSGLADVEGDLTFETWLALDPELLDPAHRRPGVEARFRVVIEDRAGRRSLLEKTLEQTLGGDAEGSEEGSGSLWHRVTVPLTLAGRGTLILETEVRSTDGGSSAPVEAALWGDPRILTGRRAAGPNLLILAVDTLRADVLGAWGDPGGLSPHLDAFAARSVRFADLTAPAPWTLPSFATLHTGLPPEVHRAGLRLPSDMPDVAENGISRLPEEVRTLAETLGSAGFETAGRYNNVYLRPTFGMQQGFDAYRGYHFKTRADVIVDDGIRWLEEHRERRFFFFFHVLDPHTPYFPPRDFCEDVARRRVPKDRQGPCRVVRTTGKDFLAEDRREWAEALYRAEVAFTDFHLGRLLQAIGDLGLADDTVILFVSDHGEELWENQDLERRYGYEPVADHGHSLYRELLHVPGVLHVPEALSLPGWEPGVWEEPIEMADFVPTVLGLLGVEPKGSVGRGSVGRGSVGRDLGRTPREELTGRARLAGFLRYGPDRVSVRRGPWKLVLPTQGDVSELYHLNRDPEEIRNLANEAGEARREIEALRGLLRRELRTRETLRRELGLPELDTRALPDRELIESLEALGYGN